MPHHCIVPLCTNSSNNNPELYFYHLPLHDKKLLQRWLVNIRRVNTNVNKHSRVYSAHFKGGKKQGKDAAPTIFAWAKQVSATRAPPKECSTPVPVTTSHSIGITTYIPPEYHVSTCTKELIIITEIHTYCDVGNNTARVVTSEASTQTELPTVSCVDANTMIEENNVENTTPSALNRSKMTQNGKILHWISIFQLLMVCFQFLGSVASNLSYGDHTKVA